jgi:hypothetical protein
MRNEIVHAKVLAEFGTLAGNPNPGEVLKRLKTFCRVEPSFDHETASYQEVWEHPEVTTLNKTSGIMGSVFCTLYELKLDLEQSNFYPTYKFLLGRIGNTKVYNIFV